MSLKIRILAASNLDMMKRIGLLFSFLTITLFCWAQNGSLNVQKDGRIDDLIAAQRRVCASDTTVNGFRIHIFMEIGNDALAHAQQVKAGFQRSFPDIPIYLTYAEPYYRLRVGDFRNRVEAEKYLRIIRPRYREAFVTSDVINRPKVSLRTTPIDPLDEE